MNPDGATPLFVDTAAFYARFQPNDKFARFDDRDVSLTDHVSAVLAGQYDVEHVFSYDATDFRALELSLVPADLDAGP